MMFKIEIEDKKKSQFTIKGLPPLSIGVGKGDYFDGYITSSKDLRKIFITKRYEDVLSINALTLLQEKKQLLDIEKGSLAVLQLINSFVRVLILERVETSKAQVYLVDTGEEMTVDISHLFEMNKILSSQPPVSFPVKFVPQQVPPEISSKEFFYLVGVKVALKIDENSPISEIQTSTLTVFENETLKNLNIIEAVNRTSMNLQRAHSFVLGISSSSFFEVKPKNQVSSDTSLSSGGIGMTVAVLIICVVTFIISIACILANKLLNHRQHITIYLDKQHKKNQTTARVVVNKSSPKQFISTKPLTNTSKNCSPNNNLKSVNVSNKETGHRTDSVPERKSKSDSVHPTSDSLRREAAWAVSPIRPSSFEACRYYSTSVDELDEEPEVKRMGEPEFKTPRRSTPILRNSHVSPVGQSLSSKHLQNHKDDGSFSSEMDFSERSTSSLELVAH